MDPLNPHGSPGSRDDHGLYRDVLLGFTAQSQKHPPSTNIVMVATVVVATHNLALGVLVGVLLLPCSLPTRLPASCWLKATASGKGEVRTYLVRGQVFFASAEQFFAELDFKEVVERW